MTLYFKSTQAPRNLIVTTLARPLNIFKPKKYLLRIYPLFHFIPGNASDERARRSDGKMHHLNTTPGSKNAKAILDAALCSGDIYRIGLACHAYADTWAHKNFVGFFDEFNAMGGYVKLLGHMSAGSKPDRPAVIWVDRRLANSIKKLDNKFTFLEAAGQLFEELRKHIVPEESEENLVKDKSALIQDISQAIGETDQKNRLKRARIECYKELSRRKEYGSTEIIDYDMEEWMDQAINENVRGFRIRCKHVIFRFIKSRISNTIPLFKDSYTWKDVLNYQLTHWYRFQEAVKAHQKDASDILFDTTLRALEWENW